jgi:hypothetical protein
MHQLTGPCNCYWCGAKRAGLCADRYPVTDHSSEEPCTLNPGHGGLHEFHHPTHPMDWPPVRRWVRLADGTVFPPNPYLT